jgi:hypothetical protein
MSSFRVTGRAMWALSCGPSMRSACTKGVCDFRYCLQFVEIDPAFKWNTGTLGISCWLELCIDRNGPLLGGLGYSD